MKVCNNCVLNENFPGISFNEQGVCNFCEDHIGYEEKHSLCKKYEQKFIDVLAANRSKSCYDCVVAFSGGKDSSYTLYVLKEKYDLNILAVSYDNWFQSDMAIKNISRVVKNLDIDLISIKPRFSTFKKIMKTVVENDFYSLKNKQRASDICTTCISLIRFQCFKFALEKDIPLVVFGMSPGQAPIVTSVVKTNPLMIKKMQDLIYIPLKEKIGSEIHPFFLEEKHFQKSDFPYSVNPLSFLPYNEQDIINRIQTFGWENPKDTDPNSTNCLLNSLANHVHFKKNGFHAYCYELSELIRDGKLSRDVALAKINSDENKQLIDELCSEIGIV